MSCRGFAGKWSHYEESLRVPLIIYDPRAPKERSGRVVGAMALNIDIPATILDIAGVNISKVYQGRSLVPWLEGRPPSEWRTGFFCEHLFENDKIPKWEGVRGQRYVYARYFEQNPVYEFLHDLEKDPDQLRNLVSISDHRKLLERMRRRCDALRDHYGGPYDPSRVREYRARRKRRAR